MNEYEEALRLNNDYGGLLKSTQHIKGYIKNKIMKLKIIGQGEMFG